MKPDSTRHDLVLIGHFAIDTIILRDYNSTSYSLGGGVTYGSLAASSYDPKGRYAIVSKVGKDFNRSFLDIFKTHPIDLSGIKFTEGVSTRFTLDYHDGTRDLRSGGRAEKFGIEDLSESLFNANAIHFTPIADEYTDDFICGLLEHAKVVDETGAGDCFMAILMIQLGEKISKGIKIGTIEHELKVASAASSFLVEEKGPNGFQSKESILKRVAEKNIIPSQRPAHCPAPKN